MVKLGTWRTAVPNNTNVWHVTDLASHTDRTNPALEGVKLNSLVGRRRWDQSSTMIEVIQTNLRRMEVARNLLDQAEREVNADLLIISEQPRGPADDDRSLSDLDNTAQLVLTRSAATFAS